MGATVRQKVGGGPWWVFVNHRGQRTSKRIGDKKAALEVKRQLEAKLALGEFPIREKLASTETVRERVERWLRYSATCRERTRENYARMLRVHAYSLIGSVRLTDLTRPDVRRVIEAMRAEGKARSTINNVIAPLRQALEQAREDGLIADNPAMGLSKHFPRARDQRAVFDFLKREEGIHLLSVTESHFPRWHALFMTGIYTGLRLGELLYLQWPDLDFRGRFIEVRRGVLDGDRGETKSGKIRRVDMAEPLAECLERLRLECKREALAKGRGEMPVWVWPSESGQTPMELGNFRRRVFYRVLEKAGLRRMRPHDAFRHTFASLLLQNGESLVYVKEQCGHSSIKMTVDVYGHLVPGANRQAVDNLLCVPNPKSARKEA